MGPVSTVSVKVRGVPTRSEQVVASADKGAVVKALGSRSREAEMVPGHLQTVVALPVVVVGVRVVEAPVGDAYIYVLSREGRVGNVQTQSSLHTVRAGIETGVVALRRRYTVRDAVF